MNNTTIQIQYGGEFGGSGGCATVRLPAWLEEATMPHIRGFLKLAAQNRDKYHNAEEIIRLEAYVTKAIAEAEEAVNKASETVQNTHDRDHKADARDAERRAKKWLKRLTDVREGLTAALDKYNRRK